jgi:DDE superfamily endonuclease
MFFLCKQVLQTEKEWLDNSEKFETKWTFPNCEGAIDGKHILVKAPPNSGSSFFNYKHTFSIVLMALVDADYKFTYVDEGSNGRISDGGVFKACSLYDMMVKHTANWPGSCKLPRTDDMCTFHIVADDVFPLRDDVMKPYPFQSCTASQRIFNYHLSHARRVVENSFGILASQFRVFTKPISVDIANVNKIVLACCSLHN